MIEKEAIEKAKRIFGVDSFAEFDDQGRYYVGKCPEYPGAYIGYMGYSWEEAFKLAIEAEGL